MPLCLKRGITVSYTHLDVYKRQAYHVQFVIARDGNNDIRMFYARFDQRAHIGADVYKRQPLWVRTAGQTTFQAVKPHR